VEHERAAAAVKNWLFAQIAKKRPAPWADIVDKPFTPERLAEGTGSSKPPPSSGESVRTQFRLGCL
jgi:hypothetical protein